MTTEIHLYTLGQLRIEQNGQVLDDFISTKAVLLFVYLVNYPIEHSRKKLAAMFWSETNDEQSLKNLRTVLSSLRQQMPDALLVTRDELAINPDVSIRADARLFEDGCGKVFSADTPQSLAELQSLAEYYQGAFLANITVKEAEALEAWIDEQQRLLAQLYARLLYEIGEQAQKQAAYEIGLDYARRLVALDPYWDTARRQLMRLLAYTNRSNDALRQYDEFVQVLTDELDAAPEEETKVLYEQIRSQLIRPPEQAGIRSTIVLPDMPYVETTDDIALAQRMLNTPQCHLLTLYGISGIGKTALATQIAWHRQHLYQDGAFLVPLKNVQTARDLPYLVATTLGINISGPIEPKMLEDRILDHLKDRHMLLFLDSYEHLLPETSFLQNLLDRAARVQVVVTSQTPLNLFREWLLPLQGLRVPVADDPDAENCEAVRLFAITAQRTNPRFNLRENLAGVIRICQLVEGLPLALIIAAGWTQLIPMNRIADYIIEGKEFNLPTPVDLPPHQQSLEIMLEHTWNTLSAQEQYALTAVSIFQTTFDIDEVEQICDIRLDLLAAMIQKSLIQRFDDKYRMHQLVWRYARKKLLYSDQREALGQRYLTAMKQALQGLREQRLPLHEYLLALEMLYVNLWNYQWMAKAFQPLYMLMLSRYLFIYWETSRVDDLPALHKLFADMQGNQLDDNVRMLLNLQLARFHLRANQPEQAGINLSHVLSAALEDMSWLDWGMAFNLCTVLMPYFVQEYTHDALDASDEDLVILSAAYLKLLSLYLDTNDYDAAEELMPHLLDSLQHAVDQAPVLAVRGAIAAVRTQYVTAHQYFLLAKQCLADTHAPLLQSAFDHLIARVQRQLM